MAPASDDKALKGLETILETTTTLLGQLHDAINDIHKQPASASPAPSSSSNGKSAATPSPVPNALALAHDSASLIKAHATKVSLLIINEPFTAGAVVAVLRDLIAKPIPSLATAVEACEPRLYTRTVQKELAWRCMNILSELKALVIRIPTNGKVVAADKRQGYGSDGKGSITSTGMIWSACDSVMALGTMGVAGFFVQKTDEWRETLKDVMEELKEWGDEEPDDDEDDDEEEEEEEEEDDDDADDGNDAAVHESGISDSGDSTGGPNHAATQAMLDDFMNSQGTIPRSDPHHIRPRLESSLKRLRLVIILYQAITKRRLKKLPAPLTGTEATSNVPHRLDEVVAVLTKLPDGFGDLACAFYDLQPDDIDKAMDQCFFDAFAASEMLSQGWDGGRDEFTEWTAKFQLEIKKE